MPPRRPSTRSAFTSSPRRCWITAAISTAGSPVSTPLSGELDSADVALIPRADWGILAAMVASAGVFYVAPWGPIYVAALLVLAALSWRRLDLALPLVLLFAPFFMQPKHLGLELRLGGHRAGLKELSPSEALLLVDLAIALLRTVQPSTRQSLDWGAVRHSSFFWPALLFLAAGTVSTAAADYRHDAVQWYRWTFPEPLAYFALLLAGRRASTRWLLVLAVVGAALLTGVGALWDLWNPFGTQVGGASGASAPQQGPARARGPYGSGDNLGLLYDRALLLWFTVSLLAVRRRWWWPLSIVFVPVLFLTYSRGAWLGIGVAWLLVVSVVFPWGRWLALALLILTVLVTALGGVYVVHAFQVGHAGTVQQRFKIWKSSLAMIRDNPLLGVGPDNFIHYFAPTRKENLWQHECAPGRGYIQKDAGQEPCLSHPHNEVLDLWLTSGILGLLAFIWIQTVFWRHALPSLGLGGGRGRDIFVIGAAGAMTAALIHGLVDQSYFLPDLALIFWALCFLVCPRLRADSLQPHPEG